MSTGLRTVDRGRFGLLFTETSAGA